MHSRARRRALLAAAILALLLTAGCGGDGGEEGATAPAATTTVPEPPTTEATTTTGTGTETEPSPPPGPPFGTAPDSAPASGDGLALLTAVRLGRHEGFDRVVFEFRPGAVPGYRVRFVRPPITEDASGLPVRVDGDAFLFVRMEPASGFDLRGEGEQTYPGPFRIDGESASLEVVEEVVRTGDFEAVLGWVAGLDERAPFRAFALTGPPRIVVDVRAIDD
jgi:hypothetical protein